MPPKRNLARWPLLALILAASAGVIVWIRNFWEIPHQAANLRTLYAALTAMILLILWVLFLSGFSRRARILSLGLLLGPPLVASALLRISGVTGDLVPILTWRWSRSAKSASLAGSNTSRADTPPAFPQFLGPARDGRVDAELELDWGRHPPRQLWRTAVGPGWSAFSTTDFYAVTQEQQGESEQVTCRDLRNGKLLWTHSDPAHYKTTIAGEGPRATPTIHSGRVLTLGASGFLDCLDLATGKLLWQTNVVGEHRVKLPDWGLASSPLVWSNLVIIFPGGGERHAIAAYSLQNGKRAWSAGRDESSYSSPVLARLLGSPQILAFNSHSISAHAPGSGEWLWSFPWPGGHPHIALPLPVGESQVLISSGYGTGAVLLELNRDPTWTARQVWRSNRLKSKFANIVQLRDYFYGLDDGIMVCVEAATGAQRWKDGRFGHGQILQFKNALLLTAESGEVILVKANPEQLEIAGRFQAFRSKTWNPPALAGSFLLLRNDQEAACYDLAQPSR